MTAATALGLSACAGGTTGSDAGSSESAVPSSEATDPALKVDKPKNLKAVTDACTLLKPEQLAALGGGGEPEPDTSVFGESECYWRNDNFGVSVGINTSTGTGPKEIYEQGESADSWAPTKVGGYPAARVDETTILCRIEVGVADAASFTVNYTKFGGDSPEMQDPCGYGEKIAAEVLKNIPDA